MGKERGVGGERSLFEATNAELTQALSFWKEYPLTVDIAPKLNTLIHLVEEAGLEIALTVRESSLAGSHGDGFKILPINPETLPRGRKIDGGLVVYDFPPVIGQTEKERFGLHIYTDRNRQYLLVYRPHQRKVARFLREDVESIQISDIQAPSKTKDEIEEDQRGR